MKDRLLDRPTIVAAIGTPLTHQEKLDHISLATQLERLWKCGVHGVFAAGTMGVGPLLADGTYHELVEGIVKLPGRQGKLLVGASDLSFARTLQRIEFLNRFELDGVVVLPPFFMRFSQEELVDYYHALADVSRAPLYLYDLPQRTHATIERATVMTLAEHPNIVGIKCSGDLSESLALISHFKSQDIDFDAVIAQPDRLGDLIASGVTQHLDGIYALAPFWAMGVVDHVANGRNESAAQMQANLSSLLETMRRYGGLPALTVLMNAVGIPGQFAPRPFRQLDSLQRDSLLAEAVVQRFLATERASKKFHGIDRAEANRVPNATRPHHTVVTRNQT